MPISQKNSHMMNDETLVRQDERLDDLVDGFKIIQKPDKYCFTSDSVLLANFVRAGSKCDVLDLCSGSGIVGILLAIKNKVRSMTLLELQKEACEMSERTIKYNGLTNVSVVNCDAKNAAKVLGYEKYDVICSNPPYYRVGEGQMSPDETIALSRHEIALDLNQLVMSVKNLLKFGGNFYVVYRADRLAELLTALTENTLEPKRIIAVQPTANKPVDTVLVSAKKGGEKGLILESFLRSDIERDYTILKRK